MDMYHVLLLLYGTVATVLALTTQRSPAGHLRRIALFAVFAALVVVGVFAVSREAKRKQRNGPKARRTYEAFLSNLSASPSDVLAACRRLVDISDGQGARCRSELLKSLRAYWLRAMSKHDPHGETEALNQCGWVVATAEGDPYLRESYDWLLEQCEEVMPSPWLDYCHEAEAELREGYADDACLMIPWDALRLRIVTWEAFLRRHPTFVLRRDIEARLQDYLSTYLMGMDNSPVADRKSNALMPEVRASYEKFIQLNGDSMYHGLIKGYYSVSRSEGFKVAQRAREHLAEQAFLVR